ncbi:MAG: hypothetical protein H6631_17800 [Anaerolineaceae bacterium]|nr:hypothetical protein [Anaerolineaceae bacterium]
MKEKYKHTQIGYLLLVLYGVIILFMIYPVLMTDFNAIVLVVLIILLITLGLFATLTITVDNRLIKLHFGVGLIRKHFVLKEIETYQVVKNPWYYGWGIRYTPRGWLFNVSGFSAIELHMKNGRHYRIGTDDPAGLAQAIDEALRDAFIY